MVYRKSLSTFLVLSFSLLLMGQTDINMADPNLTTNSISKTVTEASVCLSEDCSDILLQDTSDVEQNAVTSGLELMDDTMAERDEDQER
ncbi:MAG: hypothetical protein AB8E15_00550 [Bdellovibrionales bacterium]